MWITMKKIAAGALAAAALAAVPLASYAQDKGKAKKEGGTYVLEEIVIEGRVQKPQAFYILQRSNFGFDVMVLVTEYSGAIKDSVKTDVF